ncbi:uncharacterized protein BX663DRAFT_503280 [Cokeromyces recurvatus]|uniref:uncharacterized protein n=1 Tax=Cokeromyces recurvatus TaxID=90255 RepID=UPI00221F179D|nr:uncharacterized protein BX663DRAFT_503280 [Cokeromyces recurvatus]KAI7904719.1 hypothetical protein BX663DRAFT_503280 [Cokeromyces recurvatus]
MIIASKHRTESQTFTQPPVDETGHHPFKIVDVHDIKKQLLAVERVEREEERKRKEAILERERKAHMGEEGGDTGDDDSRPAKKKKKKEMGPGVTARYMSDDVRNKTTNETALMIAGGVMKSWMLTGMNSPITPIKEKPITPLPLSRQNSNSLNTSIHDSTTPTSDAANTTISGHNNEDQPRGRGRPRRRKSGSGPDIITGKKSKAFLSGRIGHDGGLFLPPSTIGRPHLGEHSTRKVTIRDALYVLEDEYENNLDCARRTLLRAYTNYLK